jgi:hypothetical protein
MLRPLATAFALVLAGCPGSGTDAIRRTCSSTPDCDAGVRCDGGRCVSIRCPQDAVWRADLDSCVTCPTEKSPPEA